MLRRRPAFLAAFGLPLMLMQIDFTGCLPGGGTATGGASSNFNVPPVPVISFDRDRGVAPLTVAFSSSASTDDGLIVQRLWDFGDGQTSRDISPTHTFQSTGNYTVKLTLTDDSIPAGQSTRSVVIAVTEQPQARIVVDRSAAESAPAIFNFDATRSFDPDGTIEEYQWDFGDGSRELVPVVVHTFGAPGTYRVRLTVTDNNGVTGTDDIVIEVGIARPRIEFRAPPDDISNIVVSSASPLWVHTFFTVAADVPRMLSAGLDGDSDLCNAQTVLFDPDNGSVVSTIEGHADRVRSATFDSNGFIVVSGSDDRTVRINDAGSGLLLQSFGGNLDAVTSVAVSPDGNLVAYGVEDGTVAVRNRNTGALLNNFLGHAGAITSVAFSLDGTQILSGSDDRTARLWSLASGALVRTFTGHAFGVTSVAFSPIDTTLVLTGSVDQTARLWDATNGAVLARFEPRFDGGGALIGGHSNSISSVAFSPDGSLVVTGSDDATAKIWPITGGNELRTLSGHLDRVTSVAVSPDGRRIATGSTDDTARIWTASSGALERTLKQCASPVTAVAFSPDGETMLAAFGARNDTQLDTVPAQGNDVNLAVPTALDLSDVAPGQYFLWAEVNTDRTSPSRRYSAATVNVVAPFTSGIDNFTPRVPLVGDAASIVVSPTANRQIFDLGPARAGDVVRVSLLTMPGYARRFSDDQFSILLLDADQKVIAWYRDGNTLFSPDTKLVIGQDTASVFVVIDTGDSVNVAIERGAGLLGDDTIAKRQQRIFLDFDGESRLRVGGIGPVDVPAFAGSDTVKSAIKQRIVDVFAGLDVVVTTSDEGDAPELPYQSLYFGTLNPVVGIEPQFPFGAVDFVDPRNGSLTGRAFIETDLVADAVPGANDATLGIAIGNVSAHFIGHMLGLYNVEANTADIMSVTGALDDAGRALSVSPLNGGEQYGPSSIGLQDAVKLLEETVGTAP